MIGPNLFIKITKAFFYLGINRPPYCLVKLLRGLRVRLECLLVMAIVWRWHKMLPAELR
jgi:hypothetical protein